jgi:hypothetical protein
MVRRKRCNGQKLKATAKAALRTEHLRRRSFTHLPDSPSRGPSLTYQHPANPMGGLEIASDLCADDQTGDLRSKKNRWGFSVYWLEAFVA